MDQPQFRPIVGGDFRDPTNLQPIGGASYGFSSCFFLARKSRDLAKFNADTYAVFARAMYFNNWDWSDGYATSFVRPSTSAAQLNKRAAQPNKRAARPIVQNLTTIGTDVVAGISGRVVVAGITLSLGGTAVTDHGIQISLGNSDVFVGSQTVTLPEALQTFMPVAVSARISSTSILAQSTSFLGQNTSFLMPGKSASSSVNAVTSTSNLSSSTGQTSVATSFSSIISTPNQLTSTVGGGVVTVFSANGQNVTGTPTTVTYVPGFSTSTFNNPAFFGDTVTMITNAADGIATVVPVLDIRGIFVGLFGLGAEIGTDTSLFKHFSLPGLPTFTLSEDGTPKEESDDPSSSVSLSLSPTQTPTASAPSSTSPSSGSCSATQTASDCSIQCQQTAPASNATCSTTCFSTVTGCSATGTTTTTTSSATQNITIITDTPIVDYLTYAEDLAVKSKIDSFLAGNTTSSGFSTAISSSTAPATSAEPVTVSSPTSTTAAPPPPVCTPNIDDCPDAPIGRGAGQRCLCSGCTCSDGTKRKCGKDNNCGVPAPADNKCTWLQLVSNLCLDPDPKFWDPSPPISF